MQKSCELLSNFVVLRLIISLQNIEHLGSGCELLSNFVVL